MSNIVIIGGHGAIAQLTTSALVDAGHRVQSVIRNPAHAEVILGLGAEPIVLDIESAKVDDLVGAVRDADSVIFAAGAGPGSGPERKFTVDQDGALKTLEAVEELGIDRFLIISYIGVDNPASSSNSGTTLAYQQAKLAADNAVRASKSNWVIVRPGLLTDEPATGRVTIDDSLTGGITSRGNTALLLARLATQPDERSREIVNVVDGDTPIDAVQRAS